MNTQTRVTAETEPKMNKATRRELEEKLRKFPIDMSDKKLVHAKISDQGALLEKLACRGVKERHLKMLLQNSALLESIADAIQLDGFLPANENEQMAIECLGADNVFLEQSCFMRLGGVERSKVFPKRRVRCIFLEKVLPECRSSNMTGETAWKLFWFPPSHEINLSSLLTMTQLPKGDDRLKKMVSFWGFPGTFHLEGYYLLDFNTKPYVGMSFEEQNDAIKSTSLSRASSIHVFAALVMGIVTKRQYLMKPGSYHRSEARVNGCHACVGIDQGGFPDLRLDVPNHSALFLGNEGGPGMVKQKILKFLQ